MSGAVGPNSDSTRSMKAHPADDGTPLPSRVSTSRNSVVTSTAGTKRPRLSLRERRRHAKRLRRKESHDFVDRLLDEARIIADDAVASFVGQTK